MHRECILQWANSSYMVPHIDMSIDHTIDFIDTNSSSISARFFFSKQWSLNHINQLYTHDTLKKVPEFSHQPVQPTMDTLLLCYSNHMLLHSTSTRSTIFLCHSLLPWLMIKQYQPVQPRKYIGMIRILYVHRCT